jgi:hypothetical protein
VIEITNPEDKDQPFKVGPVVAHKEYHSEMTCLVEALSLKLSF